MVTIQHRGNFDKTESFLEKIKDLRFASKMDKYGQMGVKALSAATPVDTGKTAEAWDYEITEGDGYCNITFVNHNVSPWNEHVNIALLIQYGHGTRNGGYVQGRDYINPALQPVFDKMAEDAWREVKG